MASPVDRKSSFKKPVSKLYFLDDDFYPESWKNDQKMSVMLNTFRPRAVNPEHYDQKMNFWKDLIISYCNYKGSGTCSIEELKEVFKRNGTSPYCLHEVFNQMSLEGNLIDKEVFMEKPKSLAGWAVDSLLVSPLRWGIGKIKEKLISNSENESTVFVVKSAVKSQSRILLDHIRDRHSHNNITSMDDLMKDEIEALSKDGILLVLQYLSTDEKKVYIEENLVENHHKILLKFAEPHKTAQPITEIERSVFNLEQTEKFLLQNIEKKEEQLNEVLGKVKDCMKAGKKQMAKTYLRKKHMIESDMSKTFSILDNVQAMTQRILASNNDKDIVNTYKRGSEAIKSAFAASGINLDSVHDIIEDMQEIYADQEECQAALSEPMRGATFIDDAELEKELEDLLNTNVNQKPNVGGGEIEKKTEDLNLLDQELEMRLKRLRSDFTFTDEPEVAGKSQTQTPSRAGLIH